MSVSKTGNGQRELVMAINKGIRVERKGNITSVKIGWPVIIGFILLCVLCSYL